MVVEGVCCGGVLLAPDLSEVGVVVASLSTSIAPSEAGVACVGFDRETFSDFFVGVSSPSEEEEKNILRGMLSHRRTLGRGVG